MPSKKIPYKHFSKYLLRAPLFSVDFFKSITKNETISDDSLKAICEDKLVKESIFLASPDLYKELNKWLNGTLNQRKSERIKYTVFKYLSRMSSRCTPFGLFAGVAVGTFGDATHIELEKNLKNKRHTRLDMNYLVALTQSIVKIKAVREQLQFYPNTSLYQVGRQFRYVEYSYIDTKRIHHIVGANFSWYLDKIIEASKEGRTIKQLAQIIVEGDFHFEEAFAFIIELIENQILISELEPSVSGPEFIEQIFTVLKRIDHTEEIIAILEKVNKFMLKIDKSITNNISEYLKIGDLLKPLNTSFELKYLFQTDMMISCEKNTLDQSVLIKIKSTFSLLNKISFQKRETPLSQFKVAFYERYEKRPMELSKVLDKELGIGYLQNNDYGDVSMLVDDLNLPSKSNSFKERQINTNVIEDILHYKIISCIKANCDILVIEDKDFENLNLEEDWSDLPDTMSAMIEVLKINGEEKIDMSYLGGSSAVNLLGRFCHGDQELKLHLKNIIDIETKINKDKILAEIVHLPESRVGNILFRPHLRDFEIPYLANSTVNKEHQIHIEDIEIIAKDPNHLLLKSKKHTKEIIPRLSNAHNYSRDSLPVYQFLASFQNNDKRNGIGFNWGSLEDKFDFLPRVEYKDVILSCKLWNIKESDIQPLISLINEDSFLIKAIKEFMITKALPQFVLLKEGDNELLINFNNLLSVKMFLNTVKKRGKFQLKEFLHTGEGIVKESTNNYSNQIVVSFYNEEKLTKTS